MSAGNPHTQLALLGGRPAMNLRSPDWPVTGELESSWMDAVVRSGKWSWNGPHEQAFEQEYAGFIGTKHCALMANGTVTIQCALQAVGVEPGDEVIVPALTWVATAQAAMDIGANVVFADIDPESYCLSPAAFEAAITPRTRAVIPVHLYGCMCDMDAIMEIARKHNLWVIEDVAHQQGSRWRNVGAGAIGDVGSYSFQQSKVLTSGEGGAITCNDDKVYETAYCLKQVGWMPGCQQPGNRYGHNYRITEMQCVLLRGGLRRLAEQIRRREESALRIREGLAELDGPLRVARQDERVTRQSFYALTLHYDANKANGLARADFLRALSAEGIGFGGTYAAVYASPLLNLYDKTSPIPYRDAKKVQDYGKLKLPVTERVVHEEGVTLGHTHLLGSDAYIEQLLAAVAKVQRNLGSIPRS